MGDKVGVDPNRQALELLCIGIKYQYTNTQIHKYKLVYLTETGHHRYIGIFLSVSVDRQRETSGQVPKPSPVLAEGEPRYRWDPP